MPDTNTAGLAGLDLNKILTNVGPSRWRVSNKRYSAIIPISIWAPSYFLFAISISICIYFLGTKDVSPTDGDFFASSDNSFVQGRYTLLTGILIANSPQLLLSASYMAYNNLFTRLQMAQEWAMYGTGYSPLRVTVPQGMQKSTYRLQLPYKYRIPLIALSAFLHFLVSNTIYVVVSFGGYESHGNQHYGAGPGLPEDAAVLVGYSPKSLVAVPIVAAIVITIPILLSLKKFPPNVVIVGSNSLAIAAACHASSISQATGILDTQTQSEHSDGGKISRVVDDDRSTEMQQSQSNEYTDIEPASMLCDHDPKSIIAGDAGAANNADVLGRIARSEIRWGVVKMPPEWYRTFTQDDEVGHLSFGVEQDEVLPPEPGKLYA
ncbi:hypothetical protein NUW58_g906 [Xylaria curta]|uniref:Uncharacterized protein n=1 Tax=Xylaria curta TaxID=42375 RepID=A0ACC1PNV1_9PEZI|nr:hypothetical protein NUW58_g906 [Xylaria curta]